MDAIDLAHAPPVRVGGLVIEPASGMVRGGDDRRQALQPQVMRVLLTLLGAGDATLSRDDLRRQCWTGRTVGEDAIDRAIAQIRRMNAELGPGFTLETIPKVGYRLRPLPPIAEDQSAPERTRPAAPAAPLLARRNVLALGGATLVAGTIGAGILLSRRLGLPEAAGATGPLRIAVVPFDAPDGGPPGIALAQGLAHDFRSALARIDGIAVIGGDDEKSTPQSLAAARRRGAGVVIGGAIAQAGDTLRASIDLLSAADGSAIASFTKAAATTDRLTLQDATVALLIEHIVGLVGPERVARRLPNYARDPVAARHVAQAVGALEQTRILRMDGHQEQAWDAADTAFGHIRQALAIDRHDPGALIAMAALVKNGWTRAMARAPRTSAQRLEEAVRYVRAALVADPNDPGALTALADNYRRYEWRWREAENLLRRALDAAPDLIEGHWSYAYMLGTQGRCREGLVHARVLTRLAPESPWRRVALPRLLYLVGRRDQTLALYRREQALAPGNAFLVHERYVMHLAEGDAAGLQELATEVETLWRGRAIPDAIAGLIDRARAGAAAATGSPAALAAMVGRDIAAYDAAPLGPSSTLQGRASVDLLFIFALELGWAGQPSRAIDLLERALGARSLYWPASLPYGPSEFPPAMRNDPRYAILWTSDPRLAELIATRKHSIMTGQTIGVRPDGRRVASLGGE